MAFFADLHVHSRFSRATAKNLDLPNLHLWAQKKGLTLVGTGDSTHPAWCAEMREKLVPAEPGLYRLNDGDAMAVDGQVPEACRRPVRFVVSAEISNIYKKDGKTRKNHSVVLLPDLDAAEALNRRLEAIGNIRSDGRPILGLDARDLLEIVLECDERAALIPAHIWTPWFSLLGSKSGFDSVQECFGDLTEHIFAVETGLSADPPMCWRVSCLDGLTLVSNSDAHSPAKLAREANVFECPMSYPDMIEAMRTGKGFGGTVEFFPEEGKYHLDGHRKCGVRAEPGQTMEWGGTCPVCGKPLTLGVLYRVEELADRPPGHLPERRHPFRSLVPLPDILSELLRVGPQSKKVAVARESVLETFGSELDVLLETPVEELDDGPHALFGEAVRRVRSGHITLAGGYDGEFGTVRVFEEGEMDRLMGQSRLFNVPSRETGSTGGSSRKLGAVPERRVDRDESASKAQTAVLEAPSGGPDWLLGALNPEQLAAVQAPPGPVIVSAGPGTGKTRTLVYRAAWLVREMCQPPESILAVTFTNRAAAGMSERLAELLSAKAASRIICGTFHSFCLNLLREHEGRARAVADADQALARVRHAVERYRDAGGEPALRPGEVAGWISWAKQHVLGPAEAKSAFPEELAHALATVYGDYARLMEEAGLYDFDDLVMRAVQVLESDENLGNAVSGAHTHVLVDEFQDVNPAQYRLLAAMCPTGHDLFVIGDPDQSIYGFRGSDVRFFSRFSGDRPLARRVELSRNYRSTKTLLDVAWQVIREHRAPGAGQRVFSDLSGDPRVVLVRAKTHRAEAETVVHTIEKTIGGTSHFSMDSGRSDGATDGDWGFSDFAVLYRTREQAGALKEAFERSGIPYQVADTEQRARKEAIRTLTSLLRLTDHHASGNTADARDIRRAAAAAAAGVGEKTLAAVMDWGAKRGLSPWDSLVEARRFPVPGLSTNQQLRLYEFTGRLQKLAESLRGTPVTNRIQRLILRAPVEPLQTQDRATAAAVARLMRMAEPFGTDTGSFLDTLALAGDQDELDPRADRVSLLTIHAAKGLEYNGVFVCGLEDGLLPHAGRAGAVPDVDEERRLFYVAITRARKKLWLCRAEQRILRGRLEAREPSPFLADIEQRLLRAAKTGRAKKPAGPVQQGLPFDV
ncbi:MAG: UvrD-helicase domain-containing protein [Desulfatibacillaceae bacterium]